VLHGLWGPRVLPVVLAYKLCLAKYTSLQAVCILIKILLLLVDSYGNTFWVYLTNTCIITSTGMLG